jgi:hypothetical protein
LAVSMATAAILNKSTLLRTTSHGIWYSYKVSSSLIKVSPKIERTKICGRIRIMIIKVKKKRRIIHHPTTVWVI